MEVRTEKEVISFSDNFACKIFRRNRFGEREEPQNVFLTVFLTSDQKDKFFSNSLVSYRNPIEKMSLSCSLTPKKGLYPLFLMEKEQKGILSKKSGMITFFDFKKTDKIQIGGRIR